MDIKMMHEMIEKLTECAKHEMDNGIESVDTKEMGEVTDIIKDLSEAMYYRTLVEAMKEAEYGEEYDEYGPMDDGRRGYRGQRRDSRGRYMSNRGRRGYQEDYRMPPIYWDRDMDRDTMGKMYYTDGTSGTSGMTGGSTSGSSSNGSAMGTRGYSEGSRYENARRGYEEKKTMGADKADKMKSLEEYMKELSSDVTDMIKDASPEEKSMLKTKMQTLLTKIQ